MPPGYLTTSSLRLPLSNPLDTPARRAPLAATALRNPVWVQLAGKRGGISLGYRARVYGPGIWTARLIHRGQRCEKLLGHADDPGAAPGALSFADAAQTALAWAASEKTQLPSGDDDPDNPTLRGAIAVYCEARIRRARAAGLNAQYRLFKHVLNDPRLADTQLTRLTPASLTAWRRGLSSMKRSSFNRLLNDLRAAITAALPAQTLPPFLKAALRAEPGATVAREIQTISPADLRRLLEAADQLDPNFGQLVLTLAVTGARYSQIIRTRVVDLQLVTGRSRLLVPASAKGRANKVNRAIPVPISDDVADKLRPLTHGRQGHEPLLLRQDGTPWGTNKMFVPWQQMLEAAGLPATLLPYALRHSSIVRMLSQSIPIRFVAQLHDSSVVMIERHYSRFFSDEVEDRVRPAVISFSFESAEIVPLHRPPDGGEPLRDLESEASKPAGAPPVNVTYLKASPRRPGQRVPPRSPAVRMAIAAAADGLKIIGVPMAIILANRYFDDSTFSNAALYPPIRISRYDWIVFPPPIPISWPPGQPPRLTRLPPLRVDPRYGLRPPRRHGRPRKLDPAVGDPVFFDGLMVMVEAMTKDGQPQGRLLRGFADYLAASTRQPRARVEVQLHRAWERHKKLRQAEKPQLSIVRVIRDAG